MKRIKNIITGLSLLAIIASCSKSQEKEPLERIGEDLVFDNIDKNADYAKQFLNGTYSQLPDGYNRVIGNFLDVGTDDAVSSEDGSPVEGYRTGLVSGQNVPDNQWARNYAGIRRANMFLSKIDIVPTTPELKIQWKAEARFLRAYFYFELVKRWGGVPLIGDKIFGLNDNVNLKRNTADECYDYVLSEIEAVKDLLLPAVVADQNIGRANKGAALALKSRILLYRASPLSNPGGDLQRWQAAADAAKDLMQLGNYSLGTDFIALFNATKNTEIIFMKEQSQNQTVETNNGPIGYTIGNGTTSPTQNLVDAFPMKNGKMPTETGSGYDAANPYAGRDPRFAATIMFNTTKWLNRPVETFNGGLDRPGGSRVQTKTGYYLRKFMGKFESSGVYSNQSHHVMLFRYAEILLNYAEAVNEVNGPVAEVMNAITAIRKRAGITAGTDARYGIAAGITKDQMRSLIRNERRVEMAFEEQRFWDIRRWKIAEQVLNAPLKGVNIVKNADGTFNYTILDIAPAVFDASKNYLFPIPYSEIQTNPNMTQNPGYTY
ncbi:RagB/SusD family nutrient uptake outer membrane protein [Pedobacter sp. KBW06]|uniref:RagB/SusD family nutrient uptake outer membrane protein n=1 Tax=Pedobacter sp. KBW06 TaxID=2153359 RepID=UPI000F5ADDD4|nr:RagB/SusD family nutrient uptake outer membrane protein [Pedobacter sp. KBW06]RQO70556.1 RagB/SusD family nutrient uptake outer membrane protein [Pedobacter sp. KBW06]